MNRLEGANCAGLPGFVIDKYFDCNTAREPLLRDVALAICRRCVVMEECRDQAFSGPTRDRGVIGGVTASELRSGREWRAYELGIREQAPRHQRPNWLQRSEAAETAEQTLLESDADEPADYVFDSGSRGVQRAVVTHASQTAQTRPPKVRPAKPKPSYLHRFNVDVPVPLPGALCDSMPRELVDKYFNANILTESAAARVGMVICDHCPIIGTCFKRALNGGNVRRSGVIAGMGARELERGRTWLRFEQGTRQEPPSSSRPDWLPKSPAGDQFEDSALTVVATEKDL